VTDEAPLTTTDAARRTRLRAALIGLIAILANVELFLLLTKPAGRQWLAALDNYTYLGVFLITLIGNATVIVPVPYLALIASVAAQTDNLAAVIVAGALGSALGESVAFFVGRSGRGVVEDTRFYRWVQRHMRQPWRAVLILFGLSAPPNPAFDVAGLAAGALGLPYWLFFSAVFLGRLIRVGLIALVGVNLGA
jgi:membrane protein YqaA with SNARE-associated domain